MKGKGLLGFSTVLLLIGCGGGSGGNVGSNPNNNQQGGNLATSSDTINSINRSTSFYTSIQRSLASLGVPTPIIPFTLPSPTIRQNSLSTKQVSCSTFSSAGNNIDSDDDGFPIDARHSFDCTYTPNQGTVIQYSGRTHVKDDNDNDPQSGWDICTGTIGAGGCSRNPITITYSLSSNTISSNVVVDADLDGNPISGYTFTTYLIKYEWAAAGSQVSLTIDGSGLSFQPSNDDDSDPWNRGTFNGTITASVEGSQDTLTWRIDLNNVTVGYCSNGRANTGTITMSFTCPQGSAVSQATFTINITSCNSASLSGQNCDGTSFSLP